MKKSANGSNGSSALDARIQESQMTAKESLMLFLMPLLFPLLLITLVYDMIQVEKDYRNY
jgi:hypothetical protein